MQMFGSIIKITFLSFALISQLSQASPLPGIEDKIKSETKAVKETTEATKAQLNDAKAVNKETKYTADELSNLKREYDALRAYSSTQDTRIGELESKVQDISSALSANVRRKRHSPQVYCYDHHTGWDAYSNAPIMYLDRQNVFCPKPYFLSRFHLTRQGGSLHSNVRFNYRCCKVNFIMG